MRPLTPRPPARAALALRCALTFLLLGALPAGAAVERLGELTVPTRQRVDLELDPDRAEYRGSVEVELAVARPTREVRFHAEDLELGRVELVSGDRRLALAAEVGERGLVTARAEEEIGAGSWRLEIDFSGTYGTRTVGLYKSEQAGRGYLFTQFEATDARRAFPCWDEPGFKIPYRLTLRVPEGQTALTDTPVAGAETADGWTTVRFEDTPPLPSYLLAIAVGPFDSIDIPGLSVPGKIYTVAGQGGLGAAAAEVTPPILAALERWFGSPYPFAKLDLIAVPDYWPGAMENPGLVTFSDGILLLDPAAASVGQRKQLISITAHELAHMWFGDLVTMQWWDDLWLNESFADWMGQKISQQLYPELGYDLSDLRDSQQIMEVDARPASPAIRKPVESTSDVFDGLGLAYEKGRAVLGMVEGWIGPERFRAGVLRYLGAHTWGNATAADLWSALSEVSGEDVPGVMASFIDQPGHPLIELEVGPEGRVVLRQRRFLNAGVEAPAQRWKVPVVLEAGAGGEVRRHSLLLDRETATVELGGPVDWVLPNGGAAGYYRWRLPAAMLGRLAEAGGELTPRERIELVGNAEALLGAGELAGDAFLELLHASARDPEPAVVAVVLDGLGKVELAFVPDALRDAYAPWLRATLRPALDRWGMRPRPGEPAEVALLRPRLLGRLGDEGRDPEVLAFATELAARYREQPTAVDPSLAGVALRLAAMGGDRALFDDYRRRFEQAKVPADRDRYLEALGAFRNPAIREEALRYALAGPVRPNELFDVAGQLTESDEGSDRLLRWVTENYSTIASRLPPDFVAFLAFAGGGCSAERLAGAQRFFAVPEHRVDGTGKQLDRVAQQVEDCLALRRREGTAARRYLEGFDVAGR
jgi:alanyl aminopeptidase